MTRTRIQRARQSLTWALVAATTVAAGGLVATDADACFGTPRPPVCSRSTSLLKISPTPTVLVPAGVTMVSVPIVVRIAFSGACAPPLSTTVTLASTTCLPGGPGGTGTVTFPSLLPGTYTGSITMSFGAGPARICGVAGTATTTWADGVTTSGTGDAVVCLVDPAPGMPGVARLDVERLSPGLLEAHPGDQVLYEYRITNNDPTESVEVLITADSEQTARLGGITGVGPFSGDGTYAIADPGTGDNFPIAFLEDLVPTPPAGHNYLLSDGSAEQQIGLGNDGALIWLNQYDVLAGQEVITKVCAAFGTVPNGRTYSTLVYDDPDNDGDPSDAVLLTRTEATVAAAGTGTFEEVVIVPTFVGPAGDSFFVGVIMQEIEAADAPALLDDGTDAGRSWLASSDEQCGGNVADLTANPTPVGTTASFGIPGNLLIRAQGQVGVALDWIHLPADPPGFAVPTIAKTVTLCPGESRVVSIASRSWLGCPPGSGCESRFELLGTYTDGSAVRSCAGAAHLVDDLVPPAFDCPDGGRRLPPLRKDRGFAFEAILPDWSVVECMQVGAIEVFAEGVPPLVTLEPQTQVLESTGRIIIPNRSSEGGPAAQPGLPFFVFAELHMNSALPTVQTEIVELMLVGAAPTVQPTHFGFMVKADASGSGVPSGIGAFAEGMFQVSVDGVALGGGGEEQHIPALIDQGSIDVQVIGPETIGLSFTGVFDVPPAAGSGIEDLRVLIDVSGMAGGIDVSVALPCPEDIDGDGSVGFTDLLIVLSSWGPCPGCPGDIDGSGDVGFLDLLAVLAAWGPCP